MEEGVSPSVNLLSPDPALIFVSLTRDHVSFFERNFSGVLNLSDTEICSNGEAMVFRNSSSTGARRASPGFARHVELPKS